MSEDILLSTISECEDAVQLLRNRRFFKQANSVQRMIRSFFGSGTDSGKWLNTYRSPINPKIIRGTCSLCQHSGIVGEDGILFKHCPSCGGKMYE